MNRLLAIVLLTGSFATYAQEEATGGSGVGSGWMGYLQPGVAFRMPNDLGLELNTLLGEAEDYSQIGILLGGGGLYKLNGNLLLRGSGGLLIYPTVDGNSSSVELIGGGLTNQYRWAVALRSQPEPVRIEAKPAPAAPTAAELAAAIAWQAASVLPGVLQRRVGSVPIT